jgi:hypothetical protein
VYDGVFVELYFVEKSWVQVSEDDVRKFQGEPEVGTRQSYYGNYRVALRIGNAGGVQVTVNGQNLGALGAEGEVIDRVFETAEAALTTTPGITPTLELTPTLTATSAPLRMTPPPPASATATIMPTSTITQ